MSGAMKPKPRMTPVKSILLSTALGLLVLPSLCVGSSPIDAIVVAERTKPGEKAPAPSPQHPVSYLAINGGYLDSSEPVTELKPPTRDEIGHGLKTALDSAGYETATAQHPPSLVVVYYYGELVPPAAVPFTGNFPRSNSFDHPGSWGIYSLVTPSALFRRYAENHRKYSGGGGFFPELSGMRDFDEYSHESRYFVIVSAYDCSDFTQKKPTLLWWVKLSAPKTSGGIDDILPALASASGPYLGRNFKDRQFCSVPPAADADHHRNATATPLPPPAVEGKIDADFLRDYLRSERATIFLGARTTTIDQVFDSTPSAEQSSLPPTLAQSIETYQNEKTALQEALTEKLKEVDPGAPMRRAIDRFNTENAGRISRLGQTREDIRSQLAKLAAARPNSPDKSLDRLLAEFATGVQQMEPVSDSATP